MTPVGRQTFLVERYAADLTIDQLLLAGRRVEEAAPLLISGGGTRYLGSVLLPLDEMALCLFEGTSEEVLRGALKQAVLAFERITPAVPVSPRSTTLGHRRCRSEADGLLTLATQSEMTPAGATIDRR